MSRTPQEREQDLNRGRRLDPLDLPTEIKEAAREQILRTIRELAAHSDKEGWVRPRDLFDALFEEGWPYPDPNYLIAALKEEELVVEDYLEYTPGAFAPYYRAALFTAAVSPGARGRASGLAERSI